jgi:hypothetical protein
MYMDFDQALAAITALNALWRALGGRVRLVDLGIGSYALVRSRGHAALPPERWRAYPGVPSRRGDGFATLGERGTGFEWSGI